MDEETANIARENGIATQSSFPKDVDFDVVCAFHLLEHLLSPDDSMAQISASLRPDGRLLVAVPNGGQADVLGTSWVGFRVDLEHLQDFTPRSMAELMSRHDLFVERFWTLGQPRLQDSVTHQGVAAKHRWFHRLALSLDAVRRRAVRSNILSGDYNLIILARKA